MSLRVEHSLDTGLDVLGLKDARDLIDQYDIPDDAQIQVDDSTCLLKFVWYTS